MDTVIRIIMNSVDCFVDWIRRKFKYHPDIVSKKRKLRKCINNRYTLKKKIIRLIRMKTKPRIKDGV